MSSKSDSPNDLTTEEGLVADIDLRLADLLLCDVFDMEDITRETFHAYLRAAYGQGYVDALREEERGLLCRRWGYRVPGDGEGDGRAR